MPTICQEIGVICHQTLLKFLGDVMTVKLQRQVVVSNPTHVNLLPSRNVPSHPLQLTSGKCLSVCRSPLEKSGLSYGHRLPSNQVCISKKKCVSLAKGKL